MFFDFFCDVWWNVKHGARWHHINLIFDILDLATNHLQQQF